MSEGENSLSYSKKSKREVTNFLGHELLFDYISGQLDEERKKAVDLFLSQSKEAQQDLIKILNGVKYAEQLADTIVSQSILDKVQEPETYLSVLLQKSKFDRWPISVKWSIEALVVVTGIVALLVLIPWDKALRLDLTKNNQEVILAEVRRPIKTDRDAQQSAPVAAQEPKAEFADEPPIAAAAESVKVAKAEKPKPKPPTPSATPEAALPTPVSVAAVEPKAETTPAAAPEKESKPAPGSLYRGVIKVTNAAAVSPKISERILELGGRKAGEVELGWKKNENSYYYHFTIPEAKYEDLKAFLGEYTEVDIRKETHPRVMPDGIIRLIIQVEEKKP